jgi:hypothetical protein
VEEICFRRRSLWQKEMEVRRQKAGENYPFLATYPIQFTSTFTSAGTLLLVALTFPRCMNIPGQSV